MGFLDKVKEQAAVATAVAKDAAQKGQTKLDDIQAKRAADVIFRELGMAVYAQRTGRGTSTVDDEINHLVDQLGEHEAANGQIPLTPDS